jgi:cytochrome oxidase Cu insertion factor (SCO1/SenC/PrrC family)
MDGKTRIILQAAAVIVPAVLIAGLGLKNLLPPSGARRAAELPVMKEVPPFSLEERSGRRVGRDELLGRVWIADFIFTHCAGTCPSMTSRMVELREALGRDAGKVMLVSITVDPDRDTPARLKEYAAQVGAGEDWLFLRGAQDEVARLSREGFLLGGPAPGSAPAVADGSAEAPPPDPLLHDRHFVLVDRRGRIRGYYDGVDTEVVKPLALDARALLSEPAGPPPSPSPARPE